MEKEDLKEDSSSRPTIHVDPYSYDYDFMRDKRDLEFESWRVSGSDTPTKIQRLDFERTKSAAKIIEHDPVNVAHEKSLCSARQSGINTIDAQPVKTVEHDPVNFPKHYQGKSGLIQTIDVIDEFELNYELGNVCKYILRGAKKNGIEDFRKGLWYLQRHISNLEKNK